MRTASAAVLKRPAASLTPRAPRPGTRLRRLYDVLQSARGLPITLDWRAMGYSAKGQRGALHQLMDFYGLDLRLLHRNSRPGRYHAGSAPATWVLAGEYIGPTYHDYIVQRLTKTKGDA
jgi:hypothetical protein